MKRSRSRKTVFCTTDLSRFKPTPARSPDVGAPLAVARPDRVGVRAEAGARNRKCHERYPWHSRFGRQSRRSCLARRHWNSPSYRAAAGKTSFGENCAGTLSQRGALLSSLCCNGADRDRTGDLCSAIAALSQLSYSPASVECAAAAEADRRTMEKAPRFHGAAPDRPKSRERLVIRQEDWRMEGW